METTHTVSLDPSHARKTRRALRYSAFTLGHQPKSLIDADNSVLGATHRLLRSSSPKMSTSCRPKKEDRIARILLFMRPNSSICVTGNPCSSDREMACRCSGLVTERSLNLAVLICRCPSPREFWGPLWLEISNKARKDVVVGNFEQGQERRSDILNDIRPIRPARVIHSASNPPHPMVWAVLSCFAGEGSGVSMLVTSRVCGWLGWFGPPVVTWFCVGTLGRGQGSRSRGRVWSHRTIGNRCR